MKRGERNKGGVGNYYTIPRQRRIQVRNLARKFASELLRKMDTPDWVLSHGVRHELGEENEFMDELVRIADRVEASVRKQT